MSSILVVDDTDFVRDFIWETLEFGGYDVSLAGSAEEALRFCQQRAMDLVITDLVMPEMGGLELIRSLRHSHPDLRILGISGGSDDLLKTATALGAVGTLAKPFRPRELLAMVDKILGKQRGGLWFQGTDGTSEYISVKMDRHGLNKLITATKLLPPE